MNGKCDICGDNTLFVATVDGEKTWLCTRHQGEWEKWGALAGMVAFLIRRANRPWTLKDCEAHEGHDWSEGPSGQAACRRCGGRR